MPRRDDDGYNDKPKLSWSEIDKRRDGARSGARSGSSSRKPSSGGDYSRYKSAADKFFSGELLPESLSEKLDPTGEGKARRDALKKLKDAEDFRTFASLAKSYVDTYGLPDDPYLLDRLLGHPSDQMVLKAIGEIGRRLDEGSFKAPKSLGERLKSVELGSDEPEVQDAARALAKRLRG